MHYLKETRILFRGIEGPDGQYSHVPAGADPGGGPRGPGPPPNPKF